AVKRKYVLSNMAARLLMGVAEIAEILLAGLSYALLESLGEIGAHQADRGIHRMVAGTAIDAKPLYFSPKHPFQQFDIAAWMHAEIAHQILLRLTFPVAIPAGVNDQDVAVLDLNRSRLDHGRGDDGPVIHVFRHIDDSAGTYQKIH